MNLSLFIYFLMICWGLVASSWSGVAKLWEMPRVTNQVTVLKDHKDHATDVMFSPVDDRLATASADRTAKLWKTDRTLQYSLEGHLDRLARIAFHPSGKAVVGGPLAASSGLDALARVWDLRTVKSILALEGHVKPAEISSLSKPLPGHEAKVTSLDITADSSYIATVSHDRTIKPWTNSGKEEEAMDMD